MARLRKYVGKDATLTIGENPAEEFQGKMQVYDIRGNQETFGDGWRWRYNTWHGNHLHYAFVTSDGHKISVHSRGKSRVRVLSHITDEVIHFYVPEYHGYLPAVA
jgi:hypothetical protein